MNNSAPSRETVNSAHAQHSKKWRLLAVIMAEAPDPRDKPLEELEKEITCAVCQGHYQQAKLLPCNHYSRQQDSTYTTAEFLHHSLNSLMNNSAPSRETVNSAHAQHSKKGRKSFGCKSL